MRIKLRNEGYQSRLAFCQRNFLNLQPFSFLLMSLSSSSTQPPRTVSQLFHHKHSEALFPPVTSNHPPLSHILRIYTRSSENDDASAPVTPSYNSHTAPPPSFTECWMLIRILITTFAIRGLNAMLKITRAMYSLLPFIPTLTKHSCADSGLMADGTLTMHSLHDGLSPFPLLWICSPHQWNFSSLLLPADSPYPSSWLLLACHCSAPSLRSPITLPELPEFL